MIRCSIIVAAYPAPPRRLPLARKTASGGLRPWPRLRVGRTAPQPTDAPRKNRLRYDGARRGAVLPQKKEPKPADVDYCGSKGSEGVPDGIWGGACKQHDECYGTPGNSKARCDLNLGMAIIDECTRRSYGLGAAWCVDVGLVYSTGLLLLGVTPWYHPSKDAYDAAQKPRLPGR